MKTNTKRLGIIALCLGGVLLVVGAKVWFNRVPDPTYNGKSLSEWFKVYGTLGQPPTYSSVRIVNGRLVRIRASPTVADPSIEAMEKFGSNAVPFLIRRLRHNRMDRYYENSFTNFPIFLQRRLPNPVQLQQNRLTALDVVTQLGSVANDASPALIELLYQRDSWAPRITKALRNIRADRALIRELMQRLYEEGRYAEVVRIGFEMGWRDKETATLLGGILASTNTSLHLDTIRLLESGGANAAPATAQIMAALGNPNGEIRYLAARSLEAIGTNAPEKTQSNLQQILLVSLNDRQPTVRTVARRTLVNLGVSPLPPPVDMP